MGWFNKKKKKEEEIPSLPELPKLPELSGEKEIEPMHQLPSFPNNSFGKKFSQDTIKEAINGGKEKEDAFGAKEMKKEGMMPTLPQMPTKEIPEELPRQNIPKVFEEAAKRVKESEPIFIRIDKFEESLKVFKKIKNQIMGIEKMLKDIRQIREEEQEELESWETEIKQAKEQIEKIDKDIFSKIE